MYRSFFGMRDNPFGLTPDLRYIYWSRHHREALAHLLYGVQERKGFILLTGEVGVGKTLLCRYLLRELGEGVRTALILNPVHSADQLLRRVNQDLGLEPKPNGSEKPLDRLNASLLEEYARGRNCVLIIDEAQTLPVGVLEQVRLISNLETEQSKLIQIVLVGQSELNGMLGLHVMRQLRQRVAVAYHLRAFDRRDTVGYIRRRLQLAAPTEPVEFTPGAMRAIHHHTGGVPRRINILCDRVLLAAYTSGRGVVDRRLVDAAAHEVRGRLAGLGPSPPRRRRGWVSGAAARALCSKRAAWAAATSAALATGFLVGRWWAGP